MSSQKPTSPPNNRGTDTRKTRSSTGSIFQTTAVSSPPGSPVQLRAGLSRNISVGPLATQRLWQRHNPLEKAEEASEEGGKEDVLQRISTSAVYGQKVCLMERDKQLGFGLRLTGINPVRVMEVQDDGAAARSGVRAGDQIIKVNGILVIEKSHHEVVNMIKESPVVNLLVFGVTPRTSLRNSAGPVATEEKVADTERRRSTEGVLRPSEGTTRCPISNPIPAVADFLAKIRQDGDSVLAKMAKEQAQLVLDTRARFQEDPSEENHLALEVAEKRLTELEEKLKQASLTGLDSAEDQDQVEPTVVIAQPVVKMDNHGTKLPKRSRSTLLGKNRPVSCDVSTLEKKAAKGKESHDFLSYLNPFGKKASSNPRSVEEKEDDETIEENESEHTSSGEMKEPESVNVSMGSRVAIVEPAKSGTIGGKIRGRKFSDSDEDDEDQAAETTISRLSSFFDTATRVVSSPALTGILLNYLLTQKKDTSPLLLYLVAQDYRRSIQLSKELAKDKESRRIANEIVTTFLHDRSPARVYIEDNSLIQARNILDSGQELDTALDAPAKVALSIIQKMVDTLRTNIQHGFGELYLPGGVVPTQDMSREEELVLFDNLLRNHAVQLVQSYDQGKASDLETATLCGLATAHRLFSYGLSSASWEGIGGTDSDNVSLAQISITSQGGLRHSFSHNKIARSLENLSLAPQNSTHHCHFWQKLPTFNVKTSKKSSGGMSGVFGKKKQSHRGHVFQERAFEAPSECAVCAELLWGIGPQGLLCLHCEKSVHTRCKNSLKESCQKDKRTSAGVSWKAWQPKPTKSYSISEPTPSAIETVDAPLAVDGPAAPVPSVVVTGATGNEVTIPEITEPDTGPQPPEPSSTFSPVREAYLQNQTQHSISADHILIQAQDQSSTEPSVASPGVDVDVDTEPNMRKRNTLTSDKVKEVSKKSRSSGGYVNQLVQRFESGGSDGEGRSSHQRAASDGHISIEADRISVNSREADMTDLWKEDPDMNVSESFDAKLELQQFPGFVMPKSNKDEDYLRLLVLMEFHHKIRFLVQYLKSFEYILVNRWPWSAGPEAKRLFDTLCLDCITPLIDLFKSLAERINACRNETTYGSFAENILEWMNEDNGAHMVSWVVLCSQVCCTNVLDSVRSTLKDAYRRYPELQEVLDSRHKKFLKVEELAHTRALVFSLPMIANTICKTLEKKTQKYKGESKLWKTIEKKINSLPQYINARCMPLVDIINAGQFINGLDRKEATTGDVMDFLEFPRQIFKHTVLAHQKVKLVELRSSKSSSETARYVKEETDVFAICMRNELVLMQRENEKFHLKYFKSPKAGGGKISPILPLNLFHATVGESSNSGYCLNVITMDTFVLARIIFEKKCDRDTWQTIMQSVSQSRKSDKLRPVELQVLDLCADGKHATVPAPSLPPLQPATSLVPEAKASSPSITTEQVQLISTEEKKDSQFKKALECTKQANEELKSAFCSQLSLDPDQYENVIDLVLTEGPKDAQDLLLFTLHHMSGVMDLVRDVVSRTEGGTLEARLDNNRLDQLLSLIEASRSTVEKYREVRQTNLENQSIHSGEEDSKGGEMVGEEMLQGELKDLVVPDSSEFERSLSEPSPSTLQEKAHSENQEEKNEVSSTEPQRSPSMSSQSTLGEEVPDEKQEEKDEVSSPELERSLSVHSPCTLETDVPDEKQEEKDGESLPEAERFFSLSSQSTMEEDVPDENQEEKNEEDDDPVEQARKFVALRFVTDLVQKAQKKCVSDSIMLLKEDEEKTSERNTSCSTFTSEVSESCYESTDGVSLSSDVFTMSFKEEDENGVHNGCQTPTPD